jgi:fibronectin-binding autotransporter adhesin
LNGGTLAIDGDMTTNTLSMGDGTTLSIDGTLGASGGLQTAVTGSAGANTIVVAAGSTLRATGDLGAGADVVDLAARSTSAAAPSIWRWRRRVPHLRHHRRHRQPRCGAGNDVLDVVVDTGFTVPFGGLAGFESLGKSGGGTMQVNGPASFDSVQVNGGVLSVLEHRVSVTARATTVADRRPR